MSDFNIFSHLNTMGFGRGGGSAAASDGANEKESAQIVVDAAGDGLAKLTSGVLGVNMAQLGQVSITQSIDYKGWADSEIPSLVTRLNSNGGIIAQIAHTLVKNGVIQDQSQFQDLAEGVSGGDPIAASTGSMSPSSVPNEAPESPSGGVAA